MSEQRHEMILRVQNAQMTRDRWIGVPFKWGAADCIQMAAHHLRQVGRDVPALPAYRSATGAAKALKVKGFATIAAALDGHGLERIAPASVRVGDILSMDADHRLGALVVYLGNDALIGWHESVDVAVLMRRLTALTAWRVPHG
jgi:hypothetical protein